MSCKLVEGKKSKWFPMKELKGGRLAVTQGGEIVIYGSQLFRVLGKATVLNIGCELLVRELEEGELIEVHYS